MNLLQDSYASFLNLDYRTDRRRHMELELARVGVAATRTRGMLPEEVIEQRRLDRASLTVMQNRTPGAIGCWFGQVSIMEEAHKQEKNAFVMEDDLIFCEDFHERMAIVEGFLSTNHLPANDWDVIWLGGTFHVNPPWWHTRPLRWRAHLTEVFDFDAHGGNIMSGLHQDIRRTSDPRIVRTYGAFSTHAYIVNYHSIPMIIYLLDKILHLSMGIDWAFIMNQPILNCYAFVPGCVIQMDNQSDIGRGKTIFSNFKKLGAHWFAPRMGDFDPSTYNWAEAKV